MKMEERADGQWAVIAEGEGGGTVALLPTRTAAKAVLRQWEAHQASHQRDLTEALRRLGSPAYGSGMEVALDEALVLRLGGRLPM